MVREDTVKEPGDSRDGVQTWASTWGHTRIREAGRRARNKAGYKQCRGAEPVMGRASRGGHVPSCHRYIQSACTAETDTVPTLRA